VERAAAQRRPLDIVVPVLDEEASIGEFVERVRALGLADALVFVDNASTDGTIAFLERLPEVRLVRHATNEGYGASIRDGIASSNGERIVIIDADLEYPPEAIPAIVAALDEHAAVYGSRFLDGPPPEMPLLRRIGNRVVTGFFNVLFAQRTTDLYTGMKGLRRHAIDLDDLERTGFEHVVELAARIAASGARIHDVAVRYTPRTRGVSKMRHVPETLKCVALTLVYRMRPRASRR
jgi:glycosyltransferase involved in cell wall biosynthesis